MADQENEAAERTIERRVVLSGALAGLAVGCVACGESNGVGAADQPTTVPPTIATSGPSTTTTDPPDDQVELFGGLIDVGPLDEYKRSVEQMGGFRYEPRARMWLVSYPVEFAQKAAGVYPEAMHEGLAAGVLALYQKCPHLGCRVPQCSQSQQFECPCHGSTYSNAGEYLRGPAPRGMDLFATRIVDGQVIVDTSEVIEGLPRGINVTGWELVDDGCLGDLNS